MYTNLRSCIQAQSRTTVALLPALNRCSVENREHGNLPARKQGLQKAPAGLHSLPVLDTTQWALLGK